MSFVDELLRQVVPDAAAFLRGLEPAQIEHLMTRLQEENEALREDYSGRTPAERRARREKAIAKNVRRFTGRLTAPQQALVSHHVGLLHDNAEEWLEGRLEWQRSFHALLLESPPLPEFERRLLAMSLDPNTMDSAEYRRGVEENRQILLQLCATLIETLNEKQAGRLSRRLQQWADDLEALSLR